MQFRRVLSVAVLLAATIALAHTQSLDDPQQWRGVALARALAAADTIDDPYRRAETLASIARVQTLIGETRRPQVLGCLAVRKPERHRQRNLLGPAKLLQLLHGPLVLRLGPWLDGAVFQRQTRIRNDEIEIESDRVAEALTRRARAERVVETEQARLGRRVNSVVILALETFREPHAFRIALGCLDQRGAVTFLETDLE